MLLKKIQYRYKLISQRLRIIISKFNITASNLLFIVLSGFGIFLLSGNLIRIIRKGYERYEIIQEERARNEELLRKKMQLEEDLKYYSSIEYIDIKAREDLNMVFPDQKLVYIDDSEYIDYQLEADVEEEKEMKPNWRLWYNLLF